MVRLQRAAAASHQRGQLIEAIRVSAAVAFAVAGIIVTLAGHGRTAVSIIGAAWFAVSAFFLGRAAASTVRQGVLLQEMFDTELFYLPWRPTVAGDQVPEPDVAQLARRLRPGCKKDLRILIGWYDPTGGVHQPLRGPYRPGAEPGMGRPPPAPLRRAGSCRGRDLERAGPDRRPAHRRSDDRQHACQFLHPLAGRLPDRAGIWIGQQRVAAERQRLNHLVTAELRAARRPNR